MARTKTTSGPAPTARVSEAKATAASAAAAVEEMIQRPQGGERIGSGGKALPYSVDPQLRADMASVIEIVFDEKVNLQTEMDELVAALDLDGALTPELVREELNHVEGRALRAHRLYVQSKMETSRYEYQADIAIAAMRKRATASLQHEKDQGSRTKAITNGDVDARAASLYPDEWREMNNSTRRAKLATEQLAKLSELWSGRRFSLGAIAGAQRPKF